MTGNLVAGGGVRGGANSLKSYNIETLYIKSIQPSSQVWVDSECTVDANNILFVDSITPHLRLDTPMRVQVNGDMSLGSSNAHAENANSNLYLKTIST